jgi:hypothetical protein
VRVHTLKSAFWMTPCLMFWPTSLSTEIIAMLVLPAPVEMGQSQAGPCVYKSSFQMSILMSSHMMDQTRSLPAGERSQLLAQPTTCWCAGPAIPNTSTI